MVAPLIFVDSVVLVLVNVAPLNLSTATVLPLVFNVIPSSDIATPFPSEFKATPLSFIITVEPLLFVAYILPSSSTINLLPTLIVPPLIFVVSFVLVLVNVAPSLSTDTDVPLVTNLISSLIPFVFNKIPSSDIATPFPLAFKATLSSFIIIAEPLLFIAFTLPVSASTLNELFFPLISKSPSGLTLNVPVALPVERPPSL